MIRALEPGWTTFGGRAFCHIPAGSPFDLGALSRPPDQRDRWAAPRAPTAYLASSAAVALAEWARHPEAGRARTIMSVYLQALPLVDLRSDAGLALVGAPAILAFLDRTVAGRAAAVVRGLGAPGMLVPSMAFLDRADAAFNIVLFCDQVPGGLASVVGDPCPVGRLRLDVSDA